MKLCSLCRKRKRLSDFHKSSRRTDGRQNVCKQCSKEYCAKRYQKAEYKKRNTERNKKIKSELYQKVYDYLLTHPCVDCGETDPVVLEFDHVRGTKRMEVSRLIQHCCTWETLLEEIEKCDVRCANDHRRQTAKRAGHFRSRVASSTG